MVDDNPVNRLVLTRTLMEEGALVSEADSGESALRLLQEAGSENRYALILLDSWMPGMDGFVTAERIQALPGCAGARLVMLSSSGVKGDGQRCRDIGFSAYLPKPIARDELLAALVRLLDDQGLHDEGQRPLLTRHVLRDEVIPLDVLLVEDHQVNQKLVIGLLERWGQRVTLAENGREAIEAIGRGHFDIVLMDMMMPVMDGLEATRRIRASATENGLPHLPIIAMTANAMQGDREACLEAGMDDYIAKPVRGHDLRRVLRKFGTAARTAETSFREGGRATYREQLPTLSEFDYASAVKSVDREMVEIVVTTFLEHYPKDMEKLRAGCGAEDAKSVLFVVHALRGTLAMFRAQPAVQLAQRIERLAERGDCTGMGELIELLSAELERLSAALALVAESLAGK